MRIPEFHKHPDWLQPLDHPPYAAFDASLGRGIYVGFTVGGLRVSLDGEVLTEAGDAVPGLFAAGACASNIVQDSAGYCSGICLGEAAFFGRRAGVRAPDAERLIARRRRPVAGSADVAAAEADEARGGESGGDRGECEQRHDREVRRGELRHVLER